MSRTASNGAGDGAGFVRIIGGEWRRRRLAVTPIAGLRPTGDRIRETLFNWLAPSLPGARCLDLFAGTGSLGFEAASRGAANVVMVERDALAARALRDNAATLDAAQVEIIQAEAGNWLAGATQYFDIVFLDPPFADTILSKICFQLDQGWLVRGARVYLEHSAQCEPVLPAGWQLERTKKIGRVKFALAEIRGGDYEYKRV